MPLGFPNGAHPAAGCRASPPQKTRSAETAGGAPGGAPPARLGLGRLFFCMDELWAIVARLAGPGGAL